VWGKFFAGGLSCDSKYETNFSRPQIKKLWRCGTRELTKEMGLFEKGREQFFPRLDKTLKWVRNYMEN
jgi:hypothetical protein